MAVGLPKQSSALTIGGADLPAPDLRPRRDAGAPRLGPPALRGATHRPTAGAALESAPSPRAGAGQRFGHALRTIRNVAAAGVVLGLLAGCGATLPRAPAPEPFVVDIDLEMRNGEVVRLDTETRGEDPWSAQLRIGVHEIARQAFFGRSSAAFAHYAGDDGRWGAAELTSMLARLDIGTGPFRANLVEHLLDAHDGDGDRRLSFDEFDRGVMRPGG